MHHSSFINNYAAKLKEVVCFTMCLYIHIFCKLPIYHTVACMWHIYIYIFGAFSHNYIEHDQVLTLARYSFGIT